MSKILETYNLMKDGKILARGAFYWKIEDDKVYQKTENTMWVETDILPIGDVKVVEFEICKNCGEKKVKEQMRILTLFGEEHRICRECLNNLPIW